MSDWTGTGTSIAVAGLTTQQMIELVKQHHPQMSETMIVSLLNRAKDNLCETTDILRDKDESVTTTASTIEYSLPTGTLNIYEVYVDGDGAYRMIDRPEIGESDGLVAGRYYWRTERGYIYLFAGGDTTTYISAGKTVSIYRSYLDADITADGSSHALEMPARFREALVDWAVGRGYKMPPVDRENAIFFDKNYERTLKEAKKYARSHRRTTGTIAQYDY